MGLPIQFYIQTNMDQQGVPKIVSFWIYEIYQYSCLSILKGSTLSCEVDLEEAQEWKKYKIMSKRPKIITLRFSHTI